ncbi:hypothetical protein PG996_014889 [Apiospora saccharicola]|uniref:Uncharacterized protein n=1 Tax=Apiospora saccharicola TaxID=335842 RepID=A0ABR1TJK6_9PEZI
MCIKNYVGYRCGHRDPEGTEMKTEYCHRPWRYEHEPPCKFMYRVHVRVDLHRPRDCDFCPACRELRAALMKEWGDIYVRWSQERIMPPRDLAETHKCIEYSLKYVEEKARRASVSQGPDHTAQNLYRERQDLILKPLELQVTRIKAADLEWNTKMTTAQREGRVPKSALNVLETSHKRMVELTRPVAWSVDMLMERHTQLLDQLKAEEKKASSVEE